MIEKKESVKRFVLITLTCTLFSCADKPSNKDAEKALQYHYDELIEQADQFGGFLLSGLVDDKCPDSRQELNALGEFTKGFCLIQNSTIKVNSINSCIDKEKSIVLCEVSGRRIHPVYGEDEYIGNYRFEKYPDYWVVLYDQ